MESRVIDKVREAYAVLLQWEADEAAGVAGTTDKPNAKSASEALFEARMLLQEALRNLRNCDVGTAEEQTARWWKFCDRHFTYSPVAKDNCAKCPIRGTNRHCELAWAQMPYESEAK